MNIPDDVYDYASANDLDWTATGGGIDYIVLLHGGKFYVMGDAEDFAAGAQSLDNDPVTVQVYNDCYTEDDWWSKDEWDAEYDFETARRAMDFLIELRDTTPKHPTNSIIEQFVREHNLEAEKLTRKQLAQVIEEIIASGDLTRYVRHDNNAQKVTYIPFRESHRIKKRIEALEAGIREMIEHPDYTNPEGMVQRLKSLLNT